MHLQAGYVGFFLDVCRFQDNKGQPYLEAYLTVDGGSVGYRPMEGQKGTFQASVEVDFQLHLLRAKGIPQRFTPIAITY